MTRLFLSATRSFRARTTPGLLHFLRAGLLLTLTSTVVAACLASRLLLATESGDAACSLVINGALQDIACSRDPAQGLQVSLEILGLVASGTPDIALSTRADRGHIVMTSEVKSPTVASLTGFKTTTLTLVVNGAPISARATLIAGKPYLDSITLQTVLERLSFNVLIAPDTRLISVFRLKDHAVKEPTASQNTGAFGEDGTSDPQDGGDTTSTGHSSSGQKSRSSETGSATVRPPGAGMMEAVQQGSTSSLQGLQGQAGLLGTPASGQVTAEMQALYQQMGISPAAGMGGSGTTTSSARAPEVCGAMDRLRTAWEATEPSALEKESFKRLAAVFQKAQQEMQANKQKQEAAAEKEAQATAAKGAAAAVPGAASPGQSAGNSSNAPAQKQVTLNPDDVDDFYKTLLSFQKKAKKRLEDTRSWAAPDSIRRVKLYGEDFLMTVDELLTLSAEMSKAIQDGDKSFQTRAEEDIKRIQELEKTLQEQGPRFDAEVNRVRSSHGCGPARSTSGPS